jgi:hypothetical protein
MTTQEAGTVRTQVEDEGFASQAQEQMQEKAQDLKEQASQRVRMQLNDRSTDVGEQIVSLGTALRRAAEQLQGEGKTTPADAARRAAEGVERLGRYLREGNADAFLNDAERLGQKRPWLSGGIGMALGFAASRFLKASSDRRYNTVRPARTDLHAPSTPSRTALGTGSLGAPSVQGGLPE